MGGALRPTVANEIYETIAEECGCICYAVVQASVTLNDVGAVLL